MIRRAVIWAGVSSRPQAEKDSIERQVEDGRSFCASREWLEVATLIVPGESRNYIDVADAIAGLDERLQSGEPNAYRELLRLLAARSFDVLVCRARDRLGRTDALIAGVEERCRRAGVVVWSLAMPPSGSEAGDLYVAAVERAGAQREIVELRRRHKDGMDGRASRGEIVGPIAPFGYAVVYVSQGKKFVRKVEIAQPEANAYRLAVADLLSRLITAESILQRLRAQFPERRWPTSALYSLLRNPFHVGLVIRRRRRAEGESARLRIMDPGGPSILQHPRWGEVEYLLGLRADRDYFANRDPEGRRRLTIVSPGAHQPIIEIPEWLALQRETELRSVMRHPPAIGSLWGGLVRCGLCGSRMRFHNYRHLQYAYQYYVCPQTDKRYGECAGGRIRQEVVTAGVSEFLQKLYAEMQGRINLGEEAAKPVDPTSALQAQRADLEAQRERLEIMAQTGRITLDAFDKRAAIVDDALASLSERISREAVVAASRKLVHSRFLALGSVLSGLSEMLSEADPVAANQWLSEMIESVTVLDGKVSSVKMLL